MKQQKRSYYFDYASTCPINQDVLHTYTTLLQTYFANSESTYRIGREVHQLVETSREKIANLLGVNQNEVIFTNSGSEANSLAIIGYALANQNRGKHLITSSIEHPSVLKAFAYLANKHHFDVEYVSVDEEAKVQLSQIKDAIRDDTILVSIMSVNNEVGAIQDVSEIATYLKTHKRIAFMSDGVQCVGKHPFDLKDIDLFTFSMHKIYGLKGSGILVKKQHVHLDPIIFGGVQEFGLRGGTVDAPTCIVAAKTLRLAIQNQTTNLLYVQRLKNYFVSKVHNVEGIQLNSKENASPYIINVLLLKLNSEIMMNALNQRNIFVSSQSACSSRHKKPSTTLLAMGLDETKALQAIRISLSKDTTTQDIDYLVESMQEVLNEYGIESV